MTLVIIKNICIPFYHRKCNLLKQYTIADYANRISLNFIDCNLSSKDMVLLSTYNIRID